MSARLNGYTQVDDVWYGPDHEIPAEVAAKIGPHAWVNGEHPDAAAFVDHIASLSPDGAVRSGSGTGGDDKGGGDIPDGPPPMNGKGSSDADWRAYADRVGVDVSAAQSRTEVIALIEAAGHPVDRSTS